LGLHCAPTEGADKAPTRKPAERFARGEGGHLLDRRTRGGGASLEKAGVASTAQVQVMRAGRKVQVAGMAIVRRRPETAKGVFFMTLADEQGLANNIVATPDVFARYRRVARSALFVLVSGVVERTGQVVNVKAKSFRELGLGDVLPVETRDIH
jgi:error-prone DNA polymerase